MFLQAKCQPFLSSTNSIDILKGSRKLRLFMNFCLMQPFPWHHCSLVVIFGDPWKSSKKSSDEEIFKDFQTVVFYRADMFPDTKPAVWKHRRQRVVPAGPLIKNH